MTDAPRRFVFHGSACAFSGRVFRPRDVAGIVESPASSAISVSGGLSRAALGKRKRIAPWLTVGGAETHAEGNFDNIKQAIELTHHRVNEDSLTTTTKVAAVVSDIDIKLHDPHPDPHHSDAAHHRFRLVVKSLRASLVGRNPKLGEGTPVQLGKDTDIVGLEIDGYPLKVAINRPLFQELDTYARFAEKMGQGRGAEQGGAFFVNGAASGGPIETTVVRELKWAKRTHPTAVIERNRITVPNFGKLYFGEMFITAEARRLTLLRLVFGSHTGFHVSFGDVHTDGSWYPP